MFSNWFLKSFRILLLPFALMYGLVILIRNWMYDHKLLKSASFGLPIICVGNLSVGGTGKSPMVEYIVLHLKNSFRLATLSRGYKRKTRGYALASESSSAIDIGDEPMQFYKKFPDVPIAIGEERLVAIPQLLHDRPGTEVIILDDAFQHRAVKAGINILLTEKDNLFTRDFFLPTGDLRDMRLSYKRADIIVVTKCREDLSENERVSVVKEIKPLSHQKIFFSTISYGIPYHISNRNFFFIDNETVVLLVVGIANPRLLKRYLEEKAGTYYMMQYNDHHIYTIDDWKEIKDRFEKMEGKKKIILTTEKDAVRLDKFNNELAGMPFYVLPIEHRFLFNEAQLFQNEIVAYIQTFKKPLDLHGTKANEENTP